MNKLFTFLIFSFISTGLFGQSDLIISEYVEGWSNNKSLELYNVSGDDLNLANFRLVRYSNGEDTPPPEDKWTVDLPDYELGPYEVIVITIDKRDPAGTGQNAPVWNQLQERTDIFLCPDYNISETMYFNGDDAIVIEENTGSGWVIHDIFARWGPPAPAIAPFVGSDKEDNAWTNEYPYVTGDGVAITAEHTMIRHSNISTGVTTNPSLFNPLAEYDTLSANTFTQLGWHEFDNAPANETPVWGSESFKFFVSPDAANGTQVGTLNATDTENNPLNYYIDYNNFIYIDDVRYEPFAINHSTGEITVEDNRGLAPEIIDTFYLSVTVNDGFSQTEATTAMVIVGENTSTDYNNISPKLTIYPNPAADSWIRLNSNQAFNKINITNIVGQTIHHEDLESSVQNRRIDIHGINKGLYMVTVYYPDGTQNVTRVIFK